MKILKKIMYIILITTIYLFINMIPVNAATVTVTADVLNLREKASTSSKVLLELTKGKECELLKEEGKWYQVKYNGYTGYVSKEYVKKNGDVVEENNIDEGRQEQIDNNEKNNNEQDNIEEVVTIEETTGKMSSKTKVKILPLIYASDIETLNQNATVTIIEEVNNWSYIQTSKVEGWVRSSLIKNKKTTSVDINENTNTSTSSDTNTNENNTNTIENNSSTTNTNTNTTTQTNNTNTDKNDTYKEKTMYINDSYVNVRQKPSTSSKILMTLTQNTKLTVIGEEGDWYKVSTSKGNGYVLKKLLSSSRTTTTRGGTKITEVSTRNNLDASKIETNTSTNTSKSTSTTTTTSKGQEIVTYAKKFLGVPYVYGGASTSGFDCSGFTMYVYKNFGISMKHGAQAQAKLGKEVKADKTSSSSLKENLQLGDLVLFLNYETMKEIVHLEQANV